MSESLQEIIALACVAATVVAYLRRRQRQTRQQQGGHCSGCANACGKPATGCQNPRTPPP